MFSQVELASAAFLILSRWSPSCHLSFFIFLLLSAVFYHRLFLLLTKLVFQLHQGFSYECYTQIHLQFSVARESRDFPSSLQVQFDRVLYKGIAQILVDQLSLHAQRGADSLSLIWGSQSWLYGSQKEYQVHEMLDQSLQELQLSKLWSLRNSVL